MNTATVRYLDTTDAARTFVARHAAEHLSGHSDRLTERTARHLSEACAMPRERAYDLACQSVAEHQARGLAAYIDLDRTTSHCLFLRIPGHARTVVLDLQDLLRLAVSQGRVEP
jgi:hypothetical protein